MAQYSIKLLYTALCCFQTVVQLSIKLLYTASCCSHTVAQNNIKLLYTALCCCQTVEQLSIKLLYNALCCSQNLTVFWNWSSRGVARNICIAAERLLSYTTSQYAQLYVLLLYTQRPATHLWTSEEISWWLFNSCPVRWLLQIELGDCCNCVDENR